jgi:hypothetical protein
VVGGPRLAGSPGLCGGGLMTSVWMFAAGLILMMTIGIYVVQAMLWVAVGALKVLALALQALFVTAVAILRPSAVSAAWRRVQAG